MSYRDDRDADRARIEALEGELASAKQRIEELEGKRAQALVVAGGGALATGDKKAIKRSFGQPDELRLARTFDTEFPRDKLEDLVETLRGITGQRGTTELMPSSLSWSSASAYPAMAPSLRLTVTLKNGITRLEITDNLLDATRMSSLPMIFGFMGSVLGTMFTGLVLLPLAPVVAVVGIGSSYSASRALHKRAARRRAEQLQRLFDQVVAAIERELPASTPVQQAIAVEEPPRAGERDRGRDRDKATE